MIKLIDVEPDTGAYSCTKYTIDVDGKIFTMEEWYTDNSSGTEIYDESGAWTLDYPDELQEFEPSEDPRIAKYWERYHSEVTPLIDALKVEVFGG